MPSTSGLAGQRPYDVAIVGGGIMGSSTAYFIQSLFPGAQVCVIEPDPSYAIASTLRASGGVRVLFSCPENIEMSKFGRDFIKAFATTMAVDGADALVDWVTGGYLFIVPPPHIGLLESNFEEQLRHGCEVELLTPEGLKARFPSMAVHDLGGGVHSTQDGWCDPSGLLKGFRRKAISLGVVYVEDRVVAFERDGSRVTAAALASGERIRADAFVNAAGAWSAQLCESAGMPLPVSPLRRFEHYFTCGNPIERLPYVKDVERLAFRSEGVGFSGGLVDGNEPRGFNLDVDHDYFERVVWPALAHRFPPFEAARCHRTWAGLYEQCELDGNPIMGNWRRLPNLFVVTGFSGHGMMHAPAAGRAMAELIGHGEFRTLDLGRFGYERIEAGHAYPERGIV